MRKTILPAFLLSFVFVFLAGCGKSERPVDVAAREGILLFGNGSEPQGLDPHMVTGVPENHIISALLEGLITYHPTDDNLPEPGMAERWDPNEDYSQWTFIIRDDAVWNNGDPVLASDFVYSWQRMLSPLFGAKYADMLYVILNGEQFHKGQIENFDRVGVKAINDKTLQVTLVGPTPHFPNMLKHYSWFPVHPGTVEKFGGMNEMTSRWTLEEYVGNGPFNMAEWAPNQVIRVVKSDTYWDRDRVQLNEIHFRPVSNANTEEAMFRNGELHLTNTLPPSQIAIYQQRNPEVLRIDPYLGTYYYRFNMDRPPLDNIKVRKALAMAIDKEQIVENITRGGQIPATGYTPPGMTNYEPLDMAHFNPERAKELLAEAGFPNGEGFPEMEILFNTQETHRAIAEAIQNMWKTTLGIDVTLLNQEWKVYIPSQQNQDYDISRSAWIGDYMDPITFLSMWTTGNGNNNTGWSNPTYDNLISAIKQEGDPEKRTALLHKAEEILMEDLPIAPIYWYTRIFLKDPRVQGWDPKLLDNHPYKYVSFSQEG